MSRATLQKLHATASTLGLVLIAAFFVSSVVAEMGGDHDTILRVKTAICFALFALVPIMGAAGVSGQRLAGKSRAPIIRQKKRRMQLVVMNAAFILIPCALALYWLASHGRFGAMFTAVQAIELLAGAVNITLLAQNLRAGLQMRPARSRRGRAHTTVNGEAYSLGRTP